MMSPEPTAQVGAVQMPERSARLPQFMATGDVDVSAVIGKARIAHVGVGAVGRPVVTHFARLQVQRQMIVDSGRFKPESLLTQPIVPGDVGQPKAGNAARLAGQLSATTLVDFHDGPLQDLDPLLFADLDVIVVATDNLDAELHVAELGVHLGVPVVHAAVHGESLTAQVRVVTNASADSPCLACLYGRQEWEQVNRETRFSCEGAVNGAPLASILSLPTMSPSALCALAGDLAVIQITRLILGLGVPVGNTLLEINSYTHRTVISPIARNDRCPVDHLPWVRARASAQLTHCTPGTLLGDAGFEPIGRTTFQVGGLVFVTRGVCENGHEPLVNRFVAQGKSIGRCAHCAAVVHAHPMYTHGTAPEQVLAPYFDRPLGALCAEPPGWVVIQQHERAVLFTSE